MNMDWYFMTNCNSESALTDKKRKKKKGHSVKCNKPSNPNATTQI